jgi:hypothetical protein
MYTPNIIQIMHKACILYLYIIYGLLVKKKEKESRIDACVVKVGVACLNNIKEINIEIKFFLIMFHLQRDLLCVVRINQVNFFC